MTATELQPASVAAPRPELDWERDGNGRPRILPDPAWSETDRQKWQAGRAWDDGTVGYTRVTTFAEALQDSSALTRWKMRRVALGMGRRPDYVTTAAALTTRDEDRQALDDLAEKCLEAAGPNAADVGTALHAFTERLDRGEELGTVPAEYEGTVAAYAGAVRHLRFVQWECRTVCDELEVAGTPDRIGFCDIPDPDGVVDELRIIDTKTGRVDYSAGKFSTQLAVYAHSALYHPGTGARTPLQELGAPVSTRWGLVVHVPAGANTAELLWINLEHGWHGAQQCAQVRKWRTGATAGALLTPVFARPPRPATADGTCRGRKQDGKACGYRARHSGRGLDELQRQFCGRHADQAADLGRWLAENPDADPAGGLEQLPDREPVQPSTPAVQLEGTAGVVVHPSGHVEVVSDPVPREQQEAAADRSVAAQLQRAEQLAAARREGEAETPESEDAADLDGTDAVASGPDGGPEDCPWCQNTGCSVCQPEDYATSLDASSADLAARAFAGAQQAAAVVAEQQRPARELSTITAERSDDTPVQMPVGTYALDPEAEQNGNLRPHAGLQTPEDAEWARAQAHRALLGRIHVAQSDGELQTIYRHAQTLGMADSPELAAAAGQRSAELAAQRPEAALLAALEHAPDTGTLTRLWSQYPRELWTVEAHMLAQRRWAELRS